MLLLPCGTHLQRHISTPKGCGVWCGHDMGPPWGKPFRPQEPHFWKGYVLCKTCFESTKVRHVGFGVFVAPKGG